MTAQEIGMIVIGVLMYVLLALALWSMHKNLQAGVAILARRRRNR